MSVSKEISLTNLLSTSQSVLPLVLLQLSLAPQNLQEKLTISLGITLSLSLRLYTSSINADAVFCYLAVFRGIDFRFFLVWSSCDDLYEASSLCLRDIKEEKHLSHQILNQMRCYHQQSQRTKERVRFNSPHLFGSHGNGSLQK